MNTNRTIRNPDPRAHETQPNLEPEVCPELRKIIQRTRAMSSDKILRRSQLKNKCGRAHSTSYIDVANGVFPPPFAIGTRSVGFSSNEVDAWIAARSYSSQCKTAVDMKAFVTLLVQSRDQVITKAPSLEL